MKHAKSLLGLISVIALLPLSLSATPPTSPITTQNGNTADAADVLLGFRATSGTGLSTNLQVDLGTLDNYLAGGSLHDGGLHTLSALSVNDLVATYGAGWAARSDVLFGLVASINPNFDQPTNYGSYAATPGVQSAGYSLAADTNTPDARITGVLQGMQNQNSTVNSPVTLSYATSQSDSWSTQMGSDPDFGIFPSGNFEHSTNLAGASYVVSDFYAVDANNTTSTYIGTFGIDAAGALYFSSSASSFGAAVPEPATYAALAGVLALGAAAWRRQQKKAAV